MGYENDSYFCLCEAKTVFQLLITFALLEHSEEFLALEVVLVDGIFGVSDQEPSVYSILPIKKKAKVNLQYFHLHSLLNGGKPICSIQSKASTNNAYMQTLHLEISPGSLNLAVGYLWSYAMCHMGCIKSEMVNITSFHLAQLQQAQREEKRLKESEGKDQFSQCLLVQYHHPILL